MCLGAGGKSWRVYTKHVNSSHLGGRILCYLSHECIFSMFSAITVCFVYGSSNNNDTILPSCVTWFSLYGWWQWSYVPIMKLSRENVLCSWELKKHLVTSEHMIPPPLTQGEWAIIAVLTLNLKTKWIYICTYTHLHAFVSVYIEFPFYFPFPVQHFSSFSSFIIITFGSLQTPVVSQWLWKK